MVFSQNRCPANTCWINVACGCRHFALAKCESCLPWLLFKWTKYNQASSSYVTEQLKIFSQKLLDPLTHFCSFCLQQYLNSLKASVGSQTSLLMWSPWDVCHGFALLPQFPLECHESHHWWCPSGLVDIQEPKVLWHQWYSFWAEEAWPLWPSSRVCYPCLMEGLLVFRISQNLS